MSYYSLKETIECYVAFLENPPYFSELLRISYKFKFSYPEIPDGSFFKKIMCSWVIKDYCSYMTEKEFMEDWHDPESYMRKMWPTYEEAVQNYMKYYRRK